jgi:hypothetical protein
LPIGNFGQSQVVETFARRLDVAAVQTAGGVIGCLMVE